MTYIMDKDVQRYGFSCRWWRASPPITTPCRCIVLGLCVVTRCGVRGYVKMQQSCKCDRALDRCTHSPPGGTWPPLQIAMGSIVASGPKVPLDCAIVPLERPGLPGGHWIPPDSAMYPFVCLHTTHSNYFRPSINS
jgi:hypothetical protein